jgi:biotin carboxyl carrier protein
LNWKGKILQVLVTNGDKVAEGQPLVVMESMKMESKIYAKANGIVTVFVKVGDIVDKDVPLVSVEEK